MFLLTKTTPCLADISLDASTDFSTEGFFVLSWNSSAESELLLLQSSDPDFTQAISREVPATGVITITGLENGHYYFRLSSQQDDVSSNLVELVVEHHSLGRAFLFFSIGLLLFLVLLFAIRIGEKGPIRGEES